MKIKEYVKLILLIVVMFGLPVSVALGVRNIQCSASAEQNHVEYRWSVFAGCSYKHPATGLWVPKDNYRAVGD